MSETILGIMQHALGRDEYGVQRKNGGVDWRNHYCASEGTESFALCRKAVADGLMVERAPRVLSGGDYVFIVTEAGKAHVAENSPRPPKLTAGQKRYRRWLQVADAYDISFGAWLKEHT